MAQTEISEGRVTVSGAPANKPSRMVDPGEDIQILGPPPRFVSRAGIKLEGALAEFGINPFGFNCLDAGSSTGGFTDCLLQEGAERVIAVDVGTHQLHERIRANNRVVVMEQTDVRSITVDQIGGPVDLVVGDLSFISLRLVLPALFAVAKPEADLLLLVKPQFEAGRKEVSKGSGVITNPIIWQRVLTEIWSEAQALGGAMTGLTTSSIKGRTGNVEFIGRFSSQPVAPIEESALQSGVAVAAGF